MEKNEYSKADIKKLFYEIRSFRKVQEDGVRDKVVKNIYEKAERIVDLCLKKDEKKLLSQQKIDDIITSKVTGIPIMLMILALTLWITIEGANVPSELIANFLFGIERK